MPAPNRSSKSFETTDICTPYVNSAMLPEFLGRVVRMAVRVQQLLGDRAIVEASDGGQVEVALHTAPEVHMSDTYVELVVRVNSAERVSLLTEYNLGEHIDLGVVDKTIRYVHDERFKHLFMPIS